MNGYPLRLNLLAQWRDYLELTKPKVVSMITFTAMVGMFLAGLFDTSQASDSMDPLVAVLEEFLGVYPLVGVVHRVVPASVIHHASRWRIAAQLNHRTFGFLC